MHKIYTHGAKYAKYNIDRSQIWNFQNYTLDGQGKSHLLFYHNVGEIALEKKMLLFNLHGFSLT